MRCPAMEETWTMCPATPRRSMSWIASRVAMQRPRTFTSSISRQGSLGDELSGARRPRPALLTSASMPPKRSRATANRRTMSASCRMSAGCTATRAPAATSSSASACSHAARRAPMVSEAPARARARTVSAPMPLDAPVTTMERPSRAAATTPSTAPPPGRSMPPLTSPRDQCVLRRHGRLRMPVDLSAVGKKLGSVTHTYTERDVILYALGIGAGTDELQFTYERDLKVLPTFAVIPAFPAMLNLGGAMEVNPVMVLHGEQRIELHAAIPTRGTITTTPMIKAMYD